MHLKENTVFDLGIMVTKYCPAHPLHHVTYAPPKFEVAKVNGLGDAFTRNYSICPVTMTLGHMKCCPAPSTSCDLCTYKVLKLLYLKVEE